MAALAPGYFLTWHTYGTWLHGDPAGSVDCLHNRFGYPRAPGSELMMDMARAALACEPFTLPRDARAAVDDVMRRHCDIRGWRLGALAVRSNHVHAVVTEPEVKPEPIVKQLKEWGTRTLRTGGWAGPRQRVWADHASTIYLFESGSVEEKIHYVLHLQNDPLPGHGRRSREP